MKKALYRAWLAFLPVLMLCSTEKSGQLRLPFRAMGERPVAIELAESDVRLIINGHPTEVIRLTQQERTLAQTSDLGRNFILSFHISSVPQTIVNGISFFVSEILNVHDVLILLTPTKAYRIPVSIDKEKAVMDILELLREDTSSYIQERVFAEKYLEKEIDRLNTILSSHVDSAAGNPAEGSLSDYYDLAANYKAIHQFLLNYPKNISNFRDRFLLPNFIRHQEINKLLGKRQGERWWIHFQHREDIQIIHKANKICRKLNAYISSHETGALARTISEELSELEKQLLISDSVPQDDILDTFHMGNICYNVVYWGALKTSETDSFVKETSDLEGPLRRISDSTGGITVVTNDPEIGLMAIRNHKDRFFEILFGHDGRIEEKRIQVIIEAKQIPLRYKQKFSKDEMEEWINFDIKKTVEIDDFLLEDHTLHFVLHSFQKDQENKYGVLKVQVRLHDGQNKDVYKSENTLRAAEERVSISIPLPEEFRGEFKLFISVFDLLANTAASYEHSLRIE